jgi:hypothetical protein
MVPADDPSGSDGDGSGTGPPSGFGDDAGPDDARAGAGDDAGPGHARAGQGDVDRSAGRLARLPFVRPDRHFARPRSERSFARALLVVGVTTVAVAVAVWILGGAIADAATEAGLTVDNPDRPAETFCEDDFGSGEFTPSGCDEPKRVPAGEALREAMGQYVGAMLFGVPVVWFLTGVGLHVVATLAGGDGPLTESLSIAAWGMVPSIGVSSINFVALLWVIDRHRFDATTVSAFATEVQAVLGEWGLVFGAVSAVGLAWSAVVHYHGLHRALDCSTAGAATGAVVIAALFGLLGLT